MESVVAFLFHVFLVVLLRVVVLEVAEKTCKEDSTRNANILPAEILPTRGDGELMHRYIKMIRLSIARLRRPYTNNFLSLPMALAFSDDAEQTSSSRSTRSISADKI